MKQKDYPAKFSPLAAAYYEWSISFFRDHDITLVGYSKIPDSIVSEWMTDDPQQLLSDMADGKADPDSTLPFAVYSAAYGYHDQIYAAILKDESYRTPYETIIENFFLFQEVLYYLSELDKRNYYVIPFQLLNFRAYPETLPQLREIAARLGIPTFKIPE